MAGLRARLARLDRGRGDRGSGRAVLSMIARTRLARTWGLEHARPEDTDPATYDEIEALRAMARGDFETAAALRAKHPRPECPAFEDDPDPFTRSAKRLAWMGRQYQDAGSPASTRVRALTAAGEAALRRLGLPHPRGQWKTQAPSAQGGA